MWIFLVWILFPGGWAVIGPTQVMVNQGSSLAVSCSYEPGYELYSKFWCRRGFLGFCTCITHTDGSEVTVTQDRVSIRDNHTSCSFTVTLDHVTWEDAGWYSCGVERKMWFSLKHSTEVPAQHHLPAAHPLREGACGAAPDVCGCLGKEPMQEPWPVKPAALRWPVPGHRDDQNLPRAPETPSCPFTHHCAGVVLPITATLH
ncbi:CMRF35-like molecule 3 [Guaruba guarouba]